MKKKIAVLLSGCGNKDGSEIHESVSLILSLSELNVDMEFFAPNMNFTPIHFLTNEKLAENRNVMVEAARITRSRMKPLQELSPSLFDGLALPGGFGVALHLSSWAQDGHECQVLSHVEQSLLEFHRQGKPIGAICIAPALVARVLGPRHITVTIGNDQNTIEEILKTGARHEICPVDDYVSDRENKIITTPAYMYDNAQPHQVYKGIRGFAKELVEMG